MLKNILKRTLSVIMCAILMLTAVSFLDSDLLKTDAGASLTIARDVADSKVYFYVPETIYLSPVNTNGQYNFQYYLDRENKPNGALSTSPDKTTGNVYFYCDNAKKIRSITAEGTDCVVSVGTTSSEGNIITTSMFGYTTTYSSKSIEWTLIYVDKITGRDVTVNAYSYCYAPNTEVVSAAAASKNSGTWHDSEFLGAVTWLVGFQSLSGGSYRWHATNPLYRTSVTGISGDENFDNIINPNQVSNGGSGKAREYSDPVNSTGGTGIINVDTSRYTNLNQIPNLYLGVDNILKGGQDDGDGCVSWLRFDNAEVSGIKNTNAVGNIYFGKIDHEIPTRSTVYSITGYRESHQHYENKLTMNIWLQVNPVGKALLRNAYDFMIQNYAYLREVYFIPSVWNDFLKYRDLVIENLCNPQIEEAQSTFDGYAKNLYNQVAKMTACVKAEAGSTTAYYTPYSYVNAVQINRNDILMKGSATVYYRVFDNSVFSLPLADAVDGLVNYETASYYYGDTVKMSCNEIYGYDFYGSYEDLGVTQWTSASTGALTVGGNTEYSHTCVTVPNITVTYVYDRCKMNVSFEPNGGSLTMNSNTVAYSSTYGAMPNTVKKGYIFNGWYDAPADGNLVQPSTVVNRIDDHALYAYWTPKQITVTFDGGDVEFEIKSKTITFDTPYGELPELTKTGSTFSGWYTDPYNGNRVTSDTILKTDIDHTLYARWDTIDYDVVFDPNGGDCDTIYKTVRYDGSYGELPTPIREGYIFNGWFTALTGGTQIFDSTRVEITENQTLYAQWTPEDYEVIFDANGGDCSVEYKDVTYELTYGALPTPTRTGYRFDGWHIDLDDDINITVGTVVTQTTDHILYARWIAREYTVTFVANGGVCDVTDMRVTYEMPYGELPEPTRVGYNFIGWYTDYYGGDNIIADNIVETASSHSLYAQWVEKTFTVKFNGNYAGAPAIASKLVTYNSTYGVMSTPVREGYTFTGWYTDPVACDRIITSTTVNITTNTTLYAHWTANQYTVVFNPNGGTVAAANKNVTYDSMYGELPIPTRSGSQFLGWYTAPSGGTKVNYDTVVKITTSQVLYAQWSENAVIVTFDGNGATGGEMPQQVFVSDIEQELDENKFVREHYVTLNYSGAKEDEVIAAPAAFALWNAGDRIFSDKESASFSTDVTLKAEWFLSSVTLPTPELEGLKFLGWTTVENSNEVEYAGGYVFETVGESMTLYAVWENDTESFELTGGAKVITKGEISYIVGITTGLSKSKLMSDYMDYEDVTVTVTLKSGFRVGTGSTVKVTSTATGAVLHEYVILIYGDINGDGAINNSDSQILSSFLSGQSVLDAAQKLAANVDANLGINNRDLSSLNSVITGRSTLDQTVGKVV